MSDLPVEYSKEISNQNKSGLLDNKFLLAIPALLFLSTLNPSGGLIKASGTPKNTSSGILKNLTKSISDLINFLPIDKITKLIDPKRIQSNVATIRKIGPYLPETYVAPLNNIILTFDKVNRAMSLMEFIASSRPYDPIIPVATADSREKFTKILNVIKEDLPKERSKDIKPILDIVTNIDKIRGATNVITSLLNPSKNLSEKISGSLEDILDLALPILGIKNVNKSKIKEMIGMFEMLRVLNEDD